MTHGTPEGYRQGCRGIACANHGSEQLMTCTEADIRFRGDYAYRTAVRAGTATAEKESFAAPRKAVAKRKVKAPKEPAPRAAAVAAEKWSDGIAHGTLTGYQNHGCRLGDQCPAKLAGGSSCLEMARARQREVYRRKHGPRVRMALPHGTSSGYRNWKCRLGAECPGPAITGLTCQEASRKAHRDARESKRESEAGRGVTR